MKKIFYMLFFSFSFFSWCSVNCFTHPGKSNYEEIYKIPYQNETERTNKLLSFSMDEQIDIFLCAEQCREDGRITYIFYKTAGDKIARIAERLQGSKDSDDKLVLIWALLHIDAECHCVKENLQVIEAINKIGNPFSGFKGNEIQEKSFNSALDTLNSRR
jgi:hypothetical protein